MSYITERDWTTEAGLRALCLFTSGTHRCGYVEVPRGHPLFGVDYNQESDAIDFDEDAVTIGKRGVLTAITASVGATRGTLRRSPDVAFDVHGGLTFSGSRKEEGDGWWFGFDCAHDGDDPGVQTTDYVVEECESLARQIVAVTGGDA